MAELTQQYRPLRVNTPLGPDALLLTGLTGTEGLSQLFTYHLDMVAPAKSTIPFDQLLGKPFAVSLDLPGGSTRYFHGVACRFAQGESDEEFVSYRAQIVPALWFLTRQVQSRIFQHKSVPEILQDVLTGLDVDFKIQGTFHSRNYCVQYRESDFAFASRLMEEEGMYYYFRHDEDKHTLVLANTPTSHPDLPIEKTLLYERTTGGNRPEGRIYDWTKVQELRTGKVTLWDHCFEMPHNPLDAVKSIQESVSVGPVSHKLKLPPVAGMELYDYPGEYAQRFDGIDPGGSERPADIQKIFEDNVRTAGIRMQEEAAAALRIDGSSGCPQMTAGHRFTLNRLPGADGDYVLTAVSHAAQLGAPYRSGENPTLTYDNTFSCIPFALPFRPARVTPRPTVRGTQTAVVVGPPGEEIFTDKYGRVKVQFHWDRHGKNDADSSCWIRVGTIWAGKNWGVIHIPRVGQEVIVDFFEGDPDQPIIIGSVYNAEQMPAFALPDQRMVSGFKSNTTPGGGGYNEITFDDKKGSEKITIHAQKDMATTVENDQTNTVHHDQTETIKNNVTFTVQEGNLTHSVVKGTATFFVKGAVSETYDETLVTVVTKDSNHFSKNGNVGIEATAGKLLGVANKDVDIQSKTAKVSILAETEIFLTVGSSQLHMKKDGTIKLIGTNITIDASSNLSLHGAKVSINGDTEALMAVSTQSFKCDPAVATVAGSLIKSAASGVHEIVGALVKIN